MEVLLENTRRKPSPENHAEEIVEQRASAYAVNLPTHDQLRTSNELRKLGIFISARSAFAT